MSAIISRLYAPEPIYKCSKCGKDFSHGYLDGNEHFCRECFIIGEVNNSDKLREMVKDQVKEYIRLLLKMVDDIL